MHLNESLYHVFDAYREVITSGNLNGEFLKKFAELELFITIRFSNFIDEVIKKSASETSIETQERLRRFDLAIKSDVNINKSLIKLIDLYSKSNDDLLARLDNIEKFTLDRFLSSGVEVINDK